MSKALISQSKGERGVSLMEVMVIMSVFAVVSLAIANSTMTGLRAYKFVSVKAAADTLAQSKMEQWAALNPSEVDATDNQTEASVTSPSVSNITFTRQSTIVVNADESRTITVTVVGNASGLPSRINASVTSTYSLWSYGG